MPAERLTKLDSGTSLIIWRIEESEEELLDRAFLTDKEKIVLEETSHPQKRLEFLAGKVCIQSLVESSGNSYQGIIKDEYGKPFLIDNTMHISISHSFPFVCAVLDPVKPTGIDIERKKDKLVSISAKFLSPSEKLVAGTDLELLCMFWAAKEAIYKEYGRKKLIFKENIGVRIEDKNLIGTLKLGETVKEYTLDTISLNEHILCYTK